MAIFYSLKTDAKRTQFYYILFTTNHLGDKHEVLESIRAKS